MPSKEWGFFSIVTSLWYRLVTIAIVTCVFYEALLLARGTAQGWSFYLSGGDVAFEVLVRLVVVAIVGLLLGTAATAGVAPVLWYFKSWRERLAGWTTMAAVIAAVFLISRYMLIYLIQWAAGFLTQPSVHGTDDFFTRALPVVKVALVAFYLAFAVILWFPRSRKAVYTSLDPMLSNKMTRRTALVTVAGTAGLVAAEYVLSNRISNVQAALPPLRPKSNILLITFDALSAEDMSLYGSALPTTPNIDAFARRATIFTRHYSASTFTTPSVAAILTGRYPSETRVYQIQGRLLPENVHQNLPHLLRAAGYATGAFISNPYPYYLARGLANDFDELPQPHFQEGNLQRLWEATQPLHQDSGVGSRVEEYFELGRIWNSMAGTSPYAWLRYRSATSFEQAQKILAKMPEGFFLWVHVFSPHFPYIPDVREQGRFIPYEEGRTFENDFEAQWQPHYEPQQQKQVDRRRLLYDEFIMTADRNFGAFMEEVESSGRLKNTTVVVSADHGESFQGGVYQHGGPDLTRPVIHIPLVIRTPDQQEGRKVALIADQTSLAPTILELAGQPRPTWMRSPSLVPWLTRDGQGEGDGMAFSQYLAKNRVFKPLRHGTVGVIDTDYQYVVYLDTQKGELRPLSEAQDWKLDRTMENPAKAQALRAVLHRRFPDLVQ
jgi:arylsulfatase A-like enzyme